MFLARRFGIQLSPRLSCCYREVLHMLCGKLTCRGQLLHCLSAIFLVCGENRCIFNPFQLLIAKWQCVICRWKGGQSLYVFIVLIFLGSSFFFFFLITDKAALWVEFHLDKRKTQLQWCYHYEKWIEVSEWNVMWRKRGKILFTRFPLWKIHLLERRILIREVSVMFSQRNHKWCL